MRQDHMPGSENDGAKMRELFQLSKHATCIQVDIHVEQPAPTHVKSRLMLRFRDSRWPTIGLDRILDEAGAEDKWPLPN